VVKLLYSCALDLPSQTNEMDQGDQMDEIPATRGESGLTPFSPLFVVSFQILHPSNTS
jgi:hypothetical protein